MTVAAPALCLVAALDRNRAIGRGGQLPWHLPDDLKRFKQLTLDHTILMGRKTAEALGRALPKRRNLVLTRGNLLPFAGMSRVGSVDEAIALAAGEALMVIGGGEVYALTLERATHLQLTHVHTEVTDADAFFPTFDAAQWQLTECIAHPADDTHAHAFDFKAYSRS